jgi:predicted ATPase
VLEYLEKKRATAEAKKASRKSEIDDTSAAVETAESARAGSARSNFPHFVTSFVGRDSETKELCGLISSSRLVTLTGIGGVGKTRLALHVADLLCDQYVDGTWFTSLASVVDRNIVLQEIAAVFDIIEQNESTLLKNLSAYLRHKNLLLVLDNCEHQTEICAEVSSAILRACPTVHIVITSREPLKIAGEQLYRVPTLSLAEKDAAATPATIVHSEAATLFIIRARSTNSGFIMTDSDAIAIAEICRQLDGIPLAIELAAAMMGTLSAADICSRIAENLQAVKGNSRDALPRHQTLSAMLEWSYSLLTPLEQQTLRDFSVFSNGWTLAAAVSVCTREGVDGSDVVELLTSLIEKSLVVADSTSHGMRYGLLETVRRYSAEKLKSSGNEMKIRNRHLIYFLELAESCAAQMRQTETPNLLDTLEAEHDNFRAALNWSIICSRSSESGNKSQIDIIAEQGLRLGAALGRFWQLRGYLTEGRSRLSELLKFQYPDSALSSKAWALRWAGTLAWGQGDNKTATDLCRESLELCRALKEPRETGWAAMALGNICLDLGQVEEARALMVEAKSIFQQLDEVNSLGYALNSLGNISVFQQNPAEAGAFYSAALAIQKSDENRALTHTNLGKLAFYTQDFAGSRKELDRAFALLAPLGSQTLAPAPYIWLAALAIEASDALQARSYLERSLSACREIGDMRSTIDILSFAGAVLAMEGRFEPSASLYGTSDAIRRQIGSVSEPYKASYFDKEIDRVRQQLGDGLFEQQWTVGALHTIDDAVANAQLGVRS